MNPQVTQTGFLAGITKYDFKNDQGEQVKGVNVLLSVPADPEKTNQKGADVMFLVSQDLTLFDRLDAKLVHTKVDVSCELIVGKKSAKLVPLSMKKSA